MYRCEIRRLPEDAVLGRSLFNSKAGVLLRAGVFVTERSRSQIAEHGYTHLVLLHSGEALRPEFITPELHLTVERQLSDAVDFLLTTGLDPSATRPGLGRRLDSALQASLPAFVLDICDNRTLTVPGHVRHSSIQWLDEAIAAAAVAVFLGNRLGYNNPTLLRLAYGMLFRDLGQRFLPWELLNRPAALDDTEWRQVRRHPQTGYGILRALDWGGELGRLIVLQHHERADGSGYPYGLHGRHTVGRGWRESLNTSILHEVSDVGAVADVFSALAVGRPHRPPYQLPMVASMLREMAGKTLNRVVVDALLDAWDPPAPDVPGRGSTQDVWDDLPRLGVTPSGSGG